LEVTHKGNPQALEDAKTSLTQNLEQKRALVERFDALDQQKTNATKVAENIRNMKSLPGLLTPEQHEAEIRAELAQKIKEANEVDVKLAKKFRAM
jgi:hypothetical protein